MPAEPVQPTTEGFDAAPLSVHDGRLVEVDRVTYRSCGCLRNSAGAHRVGCPDYPEGVNP